MSPGVWETLGRILLAAVLGAIVGIDREHLKKPAGIRTLMMVSFGGALLTLTGIKIAGESPEGFDTEALSRLAQGIIGGIGFLGAGVIIINRGHVRGVTTAAGLWVTAGIGIACGLGAYLLAVAGAGLAVLTFLSSRVIEPGDEPELSMEDDQPDDNQTPGGSGS